MVMKSWEAICYLESKNRGTLQTYQALNRFVQILREIMF